MARTTTRRPRGKTRASVAYVRRLESLIEAAKHLNSTFDLDMLLGIILELATRNLRADRGTIYLIDDEQHILWSKVLKGTGLVEVRLPIGTGISGTVAKTGETINLKDVSKDKRFFAGFDQRSGFQTRTMLCMPMKNRQGKIIGVFQIINKTKGVFDAEDEVFLEAFSEHAAIAVENARMHQTVVESQRVEREMQIAAEMQLRLLPKQIPVIPRYEVFGEAHACHAIGGDFFDIVHLGDQRYAMVMADVSGKGIPAAMLVSTLHASLRVHLQNPKGLSERQRLIDLSMKLNALVYDNSPAEKFITFFILVLDGMTNRITYVNAGHNAPYLFRASSGTLTELQASGLPLGMMDGAAYEAEEVLVQPGDAVFMYTDGVTEAMDKAEAQFGEDRLKEVYRSNAVAGPREILSKVSEAVKLFVGAQPASDDQTMMALKRIS